jgi:hypothetical protein
VSAGVAKPRKHLMKAALAMSALALAAAGAAFIWSQASVSVNPSHAAVGGMAIRLAAEPYVTGPRIPLRLVAPTVENASFNVIREPQGDAGTSLAASTAAFSAYPDAAT